MNFQHMLKKFLFLARPKPENKFFSAPPDLTTLFDANKQFFPHKEVACSIESLNTLEKLLAEKRMRKEPPIVRFIVDRFYIARFARETHPGIPAPKHFQMTGEPQDAAQCRAAGTMKFKNSTCTVLKSINHRSGDFYPSFYSLRLFLAILVLNEKQLPFKLPRVLIVKELNGNGVITCKHKWPITQIKVWVETFIGNELLIKRLTEQNVGSKSVHYRARSWAMDPNLSLSL